MLNKFINSASIGVMDSGIGGLNVLSAIENYFTKTNLVYLGDNENAPYGNKSIYELKKLATNSISKLLDKNVKLIVVACNTLSTSIFDYIKTISPVPCIPTLPIETGGLNYKKPSIIATPTTANSSYVKEKFKNFSFVGGKFRVDFRHKSLVAFFFNHKLFWLCNETKTLNFRNFIFTYVKRQGRTNGIIFITVIYS
jgi:hypothetical protein